MQTSPVDELVATVGARSGWMVLSGAGISTESGIPDYRGPDGIRRSQDPMTFAEFSRSAEGRRRYWARSHLGWRRIATAAPNAGHRAVAALQQLGVVGPVVTQNVDRLHQAGGATDVLDLHGTLDVVVCLDCGRRCSRSDLETRLQAANPGFDALVSEVGRVNPDGDVDLDDDVVVGFELVGCRACTTGRLKPDVVFFGESVPRPRVAECYRRLDEAGALLVLGSSLTVMSGYRFVRHAAKHGYPVVIVNQGRTRGDGEATLHVWAPLGASLTELVRRLEAATVGAPAAATT
ncbi:NAD-dependent protein deacetylase [Desertihabitans brevis]|nr:NAD-dependent protein deacetylase [Desertihabitans brevis]